MTGKNAIKYLENGKFTDILYWFKNTICKKKTEKTNQRESGKGEFR